MYRAVSFRVTLMITALCGAYGLGFISHGTVVADTDEGMPFHHLDTFARALSYIEVSYVDAVDDEEVIYGAIRGMVDTLDTHSTFLTPEELEAMREDTRGEYVGIGMELDEVEETGEIEIVSPFQGGPAYESGLQSGDIILEVNGTETFGLRIQEVVTMIRGERGVPVDLLIRRDGDDDVSETIAFSVVRDAIRMVAVESHLLAPGYGVISVASFQSGVSDDVLAAIDGLDVESGTPIEGLVLDLRGNPGGLLNEAIAMSDLFLNEGIVVTTEGRDEDENEVYESREGNTRYEGPMVILVNGGSASASEIVAGALQDHARGPLMGQTTYGKATVQSVIEFSDGSGLKLTIARYYTPLHRAIHGDGIEPDFLIFSGPVDELAEPDPRDEGFEAITDRQLLMALDYLRDGTIPTE
jgi:carboxyl-terminal processing protease